jgi:hypothetical protein
MSKEQEDEIKRLQSQLNYARREIEQLYLTNENLQSQLTSEKFDFEQYRQFVNEG